MIYKQEITRPVRIKVSKSKQQEAAEDAEVSGVIIEPVAGRQLEADSVALVQLQDDATGRGRVAAVVVEVQAEDDWLLVLVQVQTHVAFEVICCREAEEVNSSDGSREDACRMHTTHQHKRRRLSSRSVVSQSRPSVLL